MAKRRRTRKSGNLGALNIQDFESARDRLTDDEHVRFATYTMVRTFLAGFDEQSASNYRNVTGNDGMVHAVDALRRVFDAEHKSWHNLINSPGTPKPQFRKDRT